MQDLDMQALGLNLLVARRRRGFSQRELSRRAQVDLSTLSRLERGHKPRVEANTLYRLSQVLGLSLDAMCQDALAPAAPDLVPARGRPPKHRLHDDADADVPAA